MLAYCFGLVRVVLARVWVVLQADPDVPEYPGLWMPLTFVAVFDHHLGEVLRRTRPTAGVAAQPVVERGVQHLGFGLDGYLTQRFPGVRGPRLRAGEHARGVEELCEN